LACYTCLTWYSGDVFAVGELCGDYSQGQGTRCHGRLEVVRQGDENRVWGVNTNARGAQGVATNGYAVVRFFAQDGRSGIETTALDLREFLSDAALGLLNVIEGHPEIQLDTWLGHIVEIACKLKGYKADVVVEQVVRSGAIAPKLSDIIYDGGGLATVIQEANP
jgi:hypothetical protein